MRKFLDYLLGLDPRTQTKENKDSIINKNEKLPNISDNTYVDIVISLNKNLGIDLTLYIDDKNYKHNFSTIEYAALCGEFFNRLNTGYINQEIAPILNNQIKNEKNSELINIILRVLSFLNTSNTDTINSNTFIKPSQVFSKFNI